MTVPQSSQHPNLDLTERLADRGETFISTLSLIGRRRRPGYEIIPTVVFLVLVEYLSPFSLFTAYAEDNPVGAALGKTSTIARSSESRIIAYQVGAFLDKKNAELLVEKLGERQFAGDIHEQSSRRRTFWIVTVAVSRSPFENLHQELLDAGFESFPIRGSFPPI
jgi:hypothetical protein